MDIESLGLHASILLAGFSGGVCYVAVQPGRPSIYTACSGILVSALVSNYLSLLAVNYIFGQQGTPNETLKGAAAFIVGLCGPWVCRAIIKKAKSYNIPDPKEGKPQ